MFNTFSTLQNALVVVQLKHAPFRADPDVCDAVAELHKAVVKAIEDMVLALEKSLCKCALRARGCWVYNAPTDGAFGPGTRFADKLKRENVPDEPRPTPDAILEALEDHIKRYNDAISLARDRSNERTEVFGQFTAVEVALVHDRLKKHASQVEAIGGQLTSTVSRFDAKMNAAVSDLTYLRRKADEAAVHDEVQRRQRQQEGTGGERGLQIVAHGTEEILGELQKMNRTLLTKVILESESKSPQQRLHSAAGSPLCSISQD